MLPMEGLVVISMRTHILGASGAGTTTLGRAFATRCDVPFHDTDDFYWQETDPPYQQPRAPEERLSLLRSVLERSSPWVLSGSLCGWGDPLIPLFDRVVFIFVPTEVRLARLREREFREFGEEALAPGGSMARSHAEFLDWARRYDTGGFDMRSLARHESWLARLTCPVIRLDGTVSVEENVASVVGADDLS